MNQYFIKVNPYGDKTINENYVIDCVPGETGVDTMSLILNELLKSLKLKYPSFTQEDIHIQVLTRLN